MRSLACTTEGRSVDPHPRELVLAGPRFEVAFLAGFTLFDQILFGTLILIEQNLFIVPTRVSFEPPYGLWSFQIQKIYLARYGWEL